MRRLAVLLSKFVLPASVILIDGIDVILDTMYFQKLKTHGGPSNGGAINEFLHVPNYAFFILFGCLMLTIVG